MSVIQFTVSKCFLKYIETVTVIWKGRRFYIVFLKVLKSLCRPIRPAKWEDDTKKEKVNKKGIWRMTKQSV